MNADRLVARLASFPPLLRAATAGLLPEEAAFKPGEADWSIVEIVCHLGDEEREDFRARVEAILRDPGEEWKPIDPVRWAGERGYAARDLAGELDRFERERNESAAWLASLRRPEWSTEKRHPKFGSMRAGDLLAAWCAHDQLHLRQIARRRFQLTQRDAGGYSIDYAGQW